MLNQIYQAEVSTQQNFNLISQYKANLSLDENGFVIIDQHSKTSRLDFVEIDSYYVGNHQLEINLGDRNIYLRGFGRHFSEFTKDFRLLYNSFLRKVLFLNGNGEANLFNCKATVTFVFSENLQFEDAELCLFEDRLSLVGDKYFTLHFSEIIRTQFNKDLYHFKIETPISIVKIYFLGRQTDLFLQLFEKKIALFSKLSVNLASQLFEISSESLSFIREGRLISQDKISEIGVKHWDNLLTKILSDDIRSKTFTLLKEYDKTAKVYYGFKRKGAFATEKPTESSATGFIHWFVFVYEKIAAVEIVSDDGYATYFYDISNATEDSIQSTFLQEQKIDINTYLLNRAYVLLDFSREPISSAKEKFAAEKAKPYAYAINKLNYLTSLRNRFIGKVGHYEKEQWEKQVNRIFETINK